MYPADFGETFQWVRGGIRDWVRREFAGLWNRVDSFFRYPPELRSPCPNCGSFFCGPYEHRERPLAFEAPHLGDWDRVERGRRCLGCDTVYGKTKSIEPHNQRWFRDLVKRAHPHL